MAMDDFGNQVGTNTNLPSTVGVAVEGEVLSPGETAAMELVEQVAEVVEEVHARLSELADAPEPAPPVEEKRITEYRMSTGVLVHLRAVNPMLIRKTANTVVIPEKPTYETVTMSGRREKHYLDEQSAKETEGGEEMWKNYIKETLAAQELQNDRITFIILAKGTELEVPDDGWEEIQEISGITVPTKPVERKVHYVLTEGSAEDLGEIMTLIMRLTGVTEETIREASDTFRGAVRNESEATG